MAACTGVGTGSITVYPNGGVPPFSYAWFTFENEWLSSTSNVSNNLIPRDYYVVITDSTGCARTFNFTVPQFQGI